jgi:hypothetical protein
MASYKLLRKQQWAKRRAPSSVLWRRPQPTQPSVTPQTLPSSRIAFSFVGDAAMSASNIQWDPEVGIGCSKSASSKGDSVAGFVGQSSLLSVGTCLMSSMLFLAAFEKKQQGDKWRALSSNQPPYNIGGDRGRKSDEHADSILVSQVPSISL